MASPKYINGSKYPNAKMTISDDLNPYVSPCTNRNYEVSTAAMQVQGPTKIDNLGSGPKGQRSKMQIKKVPFKGLK